jgi:NCS1 family nucleobase:cation symporter-1
MVVDYFLVRKGNMDLLEMYTTSPTGRYFYYKGVNFRAYAAFIIGFLLPLPGFVGSFGHKIGAAATDMYALGWVLSLLMGSLSYYVICLVFPVPGNDREGGFESKVPLDISVLVDEIYGNESDEGRALEGDEKDARIRNEPVQV